MYMEMLKSSPKVKLNRLNQRSQPPTASGSVGNVAVSVLSISSTYRKVLLHNSAQG